MSLSVIASKNARQACRPILSLFCKYLSKDIVTRTFEVHYEDISSLMSPNPNEFAKCAST